MTSLHVICGLGLPQSKILATPIKWRVPEKLFLKTFFFGEHLRLCPWSLSLASSIPSLASRVSVLEKAVLGLASDFFCVLGLEPCVLDSTSVVNKLSRFFANQALRHQSIQFLSQCAEFKRIFLIFSETRQSSKKIFLLWDQKIKCYFMMSYLARLHPPFQLLLPKIYNIFERWGLRLQGPDPLTFWMFLLGKKDYN